MKTRKGLLSPARLIPGMLLAMLLFPVLRSAATELSRPTPHELAAIIAAGGERLWYHEEEFLRNPALRATPEHVVILHLARAPKHQRFIDHAIPYIFPETATYTFCIPKKEPFLQDLELIREGSATPVVKLKRGNKCQTREIVAGFYRLQVRHDGKDIGVDGEKSFIHVPRFKVGAGVGNRLKGQQVGATLGSFPSSCDPNTFNAPQFTFTVPNGQFVAAQSGQAVHIQTTPGDTFLGAWSICPDGSGNYTFGQPGFFHSSPTFFTASGPPSTDTGIYERTGTPLKLKLTDLGNGQFTLMANFGGALYPIVVGSDNALHWATSGNPTVFTTTLKYYYIGAPLPPLQSGEVALFPACNYDDGGLGVWVFNTNVPDFSLFTIFTTPLDGLFASVKVALGTPAALSADTNYGGVTQFISSDIPCLDSTPLGNYTASSLRVIPNRQLVAATNECQNCNLSGIDLSDLDLSGGQFQGSTFTSANLTNTIFQSASLNNANFTSVNTLLTNTNLLGTIIQCTNFSGANLSSATFQFSGVVKPIVTTDFSCRLDLTGATINFNSFPLTQWRYFNLTGAKINNITGATLSTTTSPLNLSGVIFNQVSLPQVQLDGANLSCASTASGSVCTQMIETSLPSASLKKVNLGNTLLQGAHLDSANLDGANLCAAKLNESPTSQVSATLQGAFLRNVNLYQADLTGAFLANANFYSTSTPTSCASACGFTTSCASAVTAKLNNAVFTGAYLDGVDFSGSTPQSADFSNAWLAGSHFTNANLSQDPSTGKRTDFTGALLQGTTFTNATVTGANFTSAIVDLTHSTGQILLAQLAPATHLAFPEYTVAQTCTINGSFGQPCTPGCVKFATKQNTGLPGTNSTNLCPDGNIGTNADGSCSNTQWQTPKVLPPPLPPTCTLITNGNTIVTDTSDLNWLIAN